jgi:hypothetical protein
VVRERADAARNRWRVLAAAERLFAERGVAAVTMHDVVAAAGIGKGTLWRQHCRWLLQSAGAPDAGLRADLLLAGLSAEQLQHWLHDHQLPAADLADRLAAAAERLAAG